jgi:hypothetical protein
MRKIVYTIIFCFSLVPFAVNAQHIFNPESIRIVPKASDVAELHVEIILALDSNLLDVSYYEKHPEDKPAVRIVAKGGPLKCSPIIKPAMGRRKIVIVVGNLTMEAVKRFAEKDNGVGLRFDDDLRFNFGPDKDHMRPGMVSKDVINEVMEQQLSYPAKDKEVFVTELNNFYYYKNKLDFGVQPGEDSAKTSYTLNFDFQNIYKRSALLKCDSSSGQGGMKIYYGLSARLSTDSKDTLNYLNIYPLIFHSGNYRGWLPFDLDVKIGHESNQEFSNRRAIANLTFTTLVPNIIDLTSSASKRLKLKPVVGLGLKGYYDYSKNINAFWSGQAFFSAYYYIPVYDRYAIIISDKTFYDFSNERNPQKKVMSNYSVAIGTEIPRTTFKVMVKFENGRSDINYKEGKAIVLGLIMNLFAPTIK